MKKFNTEEALKGAPVKLRNGFKAYVDTCDLEGVFAYGGYAEGREDRITWTKEGTEFCNIMSQLDIVSMWEDQESETKAEVEENIFEKALRNNLPLLCEKSRFEKSYYCIAKTEDGDYLLENKEENTIERLSVFMKDLNWSIMCPKLPKAFKPKEREEFWFIHPTEPEKIKRSKFDIGNVFYQGMANIGLTFRTEEEARDALAFLLNNIEVNNG